MQIQKYKSTHNSAIFWATDSRFCMEVHMDCLNKWQSTKVQKVQKYKTRKVQKYKTAKYKNAKNAKKWKKCKNVKNIKKTQSTKIKIYKKHLGASY